MSKKRDFLSIFDLTAREVGQIFRLAARLKTGLKTGRGLTARKQLKLLAGKTLAMIFEKPSLRTRLSFEIAMTQLGGHAIYLGPSDIGLGKREAVGDIARVTASMADVIMARTFKHAAIEELARQSRVPVVNGLSDREHPCQALADLLTIKEYFGRLKGLKLAYVGDCENNMTHSLALGCASLGMDFAAAGPAGYQMDKGIEQRAKTSGRKAGVSVSQVVKPQEAVAGADVVVTDTWVSMGDEAEKDKRLKVFKPYQVNERLMKLAKKTAVFLHCLPAYRGLEVTAEVIDGAQSLVWPEAENRLHVQKALLVWLGQNS